VFINNNRLICGRVLTEIAEKCKSREKKIPKKDRRSDKFPSDSFVNDPRFFEDHSYRQAFGFKESQGLKSAISYVIGAAGPEHNDNSTSACLDDAILRSKVGSSVTLKANALVLAIARNYLSPKNVQNFEQMAISKRYPLQKYIKQSLWGGRGYSVTNNITKYQSMLVSLKCDELRNMDDLGFYYEAEREIENCRRMEIMQMALPQTYSLARSKILNRYADDTRRIASDLSQVTRTLDDKAIYYRALNGLNITSVTIDMIENIYTELDERPILF
jgi:hypothetical protein